jgi:uncharacterized membrane protein
MSHNGQKDREQQREKLEKMRKEKQERRNKIMMGGAIAAVLLVAGVAIYLALNNNPGMEYAPAEKISGGEPNSTVMTIPVSSVSSSAKFYTYDSGGTQVRFFTAIGSDGKVHVATDACDVCYNSHKGYRQTGNDMTCNNCGKSFAINNIGSKNTGGGCWPSYIPMKINGDNIEIQKSDLGAKAYMFK